MVMMTGPAVLLSSGILLPILLAAPTTAATAAAAPCYRVSSTCASLSELAP